MKNIKAFLLLMLIYLMPCSLVSAYDDCQELLHRAMDEPAKNKQVALYKEVLRQCPGDKQALNNLGVIFEDDGKFDAALEYYRKATETDSSFPHPHVGIGDIFFKQRQYDKAIEAYANFMEMVKHPEIMDQYPELRNCIPEIKEKLVICRNHGNEIVMARSIETKLRGINKRGLNLKPRGVKFKPRIALRIHFDFNSDDISPSSFQQMDEIAKALKMVSLRNCKIAIEGHTDNIGSEDYNMGLSERRARSVKNYLVSRYSIDAERLAILYFGETRPVAENNTEFGRAKNRRVELVNTGAY